VYRDRLSLNQHQAKHVPGWLLSCNAKPDLVARASNNKNQRGDIEHEPGLPTLGAIWRYCRSCRLRPFCLRTHTALYANGSGLELRAGRLAEYSQFAGLFAWGLAYRGFSPTLWQSPAVHAGRRADRSEEHTSELQSREN